MQCIWVVYAGETEQLHLQVEFTQGMTVAQAIEKSAIRQKVDLPDIFKFGIFGHQISDLEHVLQIGDRVEIYRPLKINPKDIRRNRAAKNPVGRITKGNRFKQLS